MKASGADRRSAQPLWVISAHMALLPVHTATLNPVIMLTFPETLQGVIQSELNYSVIMECLIWIIPDPVMHWTLNGKPYRTGERLIIRRLSWEQLGTYVCTAKGSQEQYSSTPVTVSLPRESPTPDLAPDPCSLAGQHPVFLVPLSSLL